MNQSERTLPVTPWTPCTLPHVTDYAMTMVDPILAARAQVKRVRVGRDGCVEISAIAQCTQKNLPTACVGVVHAAVVASPATLVVRRVRVRMSNGFRVGADSENTA